MLNYLTYYTSNYQDILTIRAQLWMTMISCEPSRENNLKKNGWLLFILLVLPIFKTLAQLPNATAEQQLEAATENKEDQETEDDTFLQEMQYFIKHPLDINTADAAVLKELTILTPLQIENILQYKNLLGNFISIYELQAVPTLDIATLQQLRLYVTVSSVHQGVYSIKKQFRGGTKTILLRSGQTVEQAKGYRLNTGAVNNFYPGSPQKIFMRYKYQYKNSLQYGVLAEKDAGEQFFTGAQKQGFDFYSAHFFVKNTGSIKALALGDFSVNLGQGLTQWQSLAFKKTADVIAIKIQLAVLRPYNAAGEINFNRGAGITLQQHHFTITGFLSFKKIDANFVATEMNEAGYVSALQSSGLHRTRSEVADKGIQRQFSFGGNISFDKNNLHLGVNGVKHQFKYPIDKGADPYNTFAISGKNWGNYSVDYSFTFKNAHFFGEAAMANHLRATAFIQGVMVSVDPKIDLSFLYRNINPRYQTLYGNAFTENSLPTNEKGWYTGINIRPNDIWRISAYADFYSFPWLKYGVNAPSVGVDYLLQLTYMPNKRVMGYARFNTATKSKNDNSGNLPLMEVTPQLKRNLRTQLNCTLNSAITLRNRMELVWFDKNKIAAEKGFLFYSELLYASLQKNYGGTVRFQYFATGGYNSRIYAYENDVLYSYAIPVFYDNGCRYYLNINYNITKKLTAWFRWAQTIYLDKNKVGSGLDEVKGNKKTELKVQVQYVF